ncbi:MAG: hypothetical protein KOO62_01195 [candidate division Zixibacteria bacterium]|nr:hypothetical protein [candidate division Zixibacteria bacterium]
MSRRINSGTVLLLLFMVYLLLVLGGCDEDTVSSDPPMLIVEPLIISNSSTVGNPPLYPAVTNVYLSNSGDGTVSYEAEWTADWLDVGKGQGLPIGSLPEQDTLWIQMLWYSLPAGEHVDSVWIVSPEATNSPQIIEVSLSIRSSMSASPKSLSFVGVRGIDPPDSQMLVCATEFSAQADFTLSSSSSWLSFSPQSSSAPDTITVSVNHVGFAAGLYYDTIVITSPQAADVFVPCSLRVTSWQKIDNAIQQDLRAITFSDDLHGWVVGNVGGAYPSGYALATVDGGKTWELQDLEQLDYMLGDVQFLDAQTGYSVGKHGFIVKTTDGGANWISQPPPDTLDLESVHFISVDTGWAVGRAGFIIHTSDGGNTWVSQEANVSLHLGGVQFVSADSGWIVGNTGLILFTADGGETWTEQDNTSNYDLTNVKFINNTTGWAVGLAGTILYTNDAGSNWTMLEGFASYALYDVTFAPSGKGWAVGSDGVVLFSDDGLSWTQMSTDFVSSLFGVYFHDDENGWVVGSEGTILHTYTGGD